MKGFRFLFLHELRALAISPSTYVAGTMFLLLVGLFFYQILAQFTQEAQDRLPMEVFFTYFWVPVWFMIPLLTMRSFAEERRLGTLDALMTTNVTPGAVVLAKFSAAYFYYCLLWALTAFFPLLAAKKLGTAASASLLSSVPMIGGYAFVALSGLLFISVGILCSALTRSVLVAGMLSFSLIFVTTVGATLLQDAGGSWLTGYEGVIDYFRLFRHLDDFTRGIIDTRPVLFHLSSALLFLGLSTLVVEGQTS